MRSKIGKLKEPESSIVVTGVGEYGEGLVREYKISLTKMNEFWESSVEHRACN